MRYVVGSGAAMPAPPVNPVVVAPSLTLHESAQAKAWIAARYPLELSTSTFPADDHVPDVFVNVIVITFEVWVNPSKLSIVWFSTPKELILPEPPFDNDGVLKT